MLLQDEMFIGLAPFRFREHSQFSDSYHLVVMLEKQLQLSQMPLPITPLFYNSTAA